MVPRPSVLVYVDSLVHAFVVIKKNLPILVRGETPREINRREPGPATPSSTASRMLASEGLETSTAQAETSTAQPDTSTAQVSLGTVMG